jgi:hypothetical protein
MYEENPNLRVHIAFMGYHVKRITDPLMRARADKLYLVTHSNDNETARKYRDNVLKILHKEKYIQIEKRTADIWNLFRCLDVYRDIIQHEKDQNSIHINVSVGSKISAISGILACMLYGKGTPYYAHIRYNDSNKSENGDETVTTIEEIPVYLLGTPKPESLSLLKILSLAPEKKMKKHTLIEKLEEVGIIDKHFSQAAKHSRLKSLLNPMGMDYPPQVLQRRVEVENKGRQSNVILTTQGENTLKIFGQ